MKYFLDISLLNCCTYQCDYCLSKAHKAVSTNIKFADSDKESYIYDNNGPTIKPGYLLNWIYSYFPSAETVIQLSGGEPLLHDAFVPIVHELLAKHYEVLVNSNGNQINTVNKQDDISSLPIKWRISWHKEFRSMDALKQDIIALKPEQVLINYVVTPISIENGSIVEDIESLKASGYLYECTPFQGEWHEETFEKTNPIYKPWLTPLPKHDIDRILYLSVRPNGNVYCCHRLFVGNIYAGYISKTEAVAKPPCFNCGLVNSYILLSETPK
jgi:organic radical activating enzyme